MLKCGAAARAPLRDEDVFPLTLGARGSDGEIVDVKDIARDDEGERDVKESPLSNDDDMDEFATCALVTTFAIMQDAIVHDCVMKGWVINSAIFDNVVHRSASTQR